MAPYKITLINVDKDHRFTASQNAVDALIESLKISIDGFEPEILSYRTSSRYRITDLILKPTHLLHIMSHGDVTGTISKSRLGGLVTKNFEIAELREFSENYKTFPDLDCVLMDACETYSRDWFREVSGLLPRGRSVVYIGTTKTVDWRECTTFTSAFYLALLQNPAPRSRTTRQEDLFSAFKASAKFWTSVSGQPSPFKAKIITSKL